MPVTPRIVKDTMNDAELRIDIQSGQFIRTGVIDGLDVSNNPTTAILFTAATLITQQLGGFGSTMVGAPSNFTYSRLVIKPFRHDAVVYYMYYTTPQYFIGGNAQYIITDDAFTENRSTNFIPGSYFPIQQYWTSIPPYLRSASDPIPTPADAKVIPYVPLDEMTFNISFSVRAITVTKVLLGALPQSQQDYNNYVNEDDPWCGKHKGYWKLLRYRTSISMYQNAWQTEATVVSRVVEDWSETGTMKNPNDGGKFITVPEPTGKPSGFTVRYMNSLPYQYGYIWPIPTTPPLAGEPALWDYKDLSTVAIGAGSGIVRFGPFKTTSFTNIFGFNTLPDQPPPSPINI